MHNLKQWKIVKTMKLELIILGLLALANVHQCGQLIGTVDQTKFERQQHNSYLYLNIESPALQDGTATDWNYCFYEPRHIADNHIASFAVYRLTESGEGSQFYNKVSETLTINIPGDELGAALRSSDFVCGVFSPKVTLNIKEGDVLGACIRNIDGGDLHIDELNIIGEDAEGHFLRRSEGGVCDDGPNETPVITLPSTIFSSNMQRAGSRILHLYANTTSLPSTADTDSENNLSSRSSTAGAVFGGMFAVAVVTLALVLVVVAVVYVTKKQANSEAESPAKRVSFSNPSYSENHSETDVGLDNANYSGNRAFQLVEVDAARQDHYEFADDSQMLTESSPVDKENDVAYYHPYDVLDSCKIPYTELLEKNKSGDIYEYLEPYEEPPTKEDEIYKQLKSHGIKPIPRDSILSTGCLGSGQFGQVEEGWWAQANGKRIPVALKTLKKGSSEEDKVKFLQEAAIMAQFRHPNVIALYGVVSQGEPVVLVVQLARKGDLKQYLTLLRPDPGELPSADLPKLLLNCSQQIALGMQYLTGKHFVHRDLAARNILVSEKTIFKVADFGMSRDLAEENYYVSQGGMIPIKWTAPEALNFKTYSTASDAWSYGCLLYEIWCLGRKPFDRMSNEMAVELIDNGYRLSPPPGCPKSIYELMIKCWHPTPSSRMVFREIVLALIEDRNTVLSIPQEDLATHKQAGVLGAPIEAGEKMYEDLQKIYHHSN